MTTSRDPRPPAPPSGSASTPLAIGLLIPAYEAAATIAAVLADTRPHGLPALVVDDGSHDDTATRAAAAGATVVRHARNLGKGAALLSGFRWLADHGYTHALSMDADGQHLGREIPKLLGAARAAPAAIVIGARTIAGQDVAAINLFGNRFANLATRLAAGVEVGDTQSGFRVYPLAATLALPVSGLHFEFETTVIVHAARAGVPVRSLPVDVYYPPAALRRTHYRKVVDTLRIIRAVAPLLIRRLRGGSPHLRR